VSPYNLNYAESLYQLQLTVYLRGVRGLLVQARSGMGKEEQGVLSLEDLRVVVDVLPSEYAEECVETGLTRFEEA
jgi:hypothetical protein